MQAVVQVGTAVKAFQQSSPEVRCHTYAKTGTAQVARRDGSGRLEDYGSAWLIGWHQAPEPGKRRAFACLVTHVHGHASNTGGEVCGPVVADLLRRLTGIANLVP
jgi:cell division protein FtsI/penicillin-binding protein 2